MAFYDWNGDGKKDLVDDCIEYTIYKNSTENKKNNYSNGGGISTFGAICGTIITLVIAGGILMNICPDIEGFPFIIMMVILCAIIGGGIAWLFDKVGF